MESTGRAVLTMQTYLRTGKHALAPSLPWTPGHDGAGVISAIGEVRTRVDPARIALCSDPPQPQPLLPFSDSAHRM
jgi:Zn-dependent alcohol dehydrogenase